MTKQLKRTPEEQKLYNNARQRAWAKAHPEKCQAIRKKWYDKNKDVALEHTKEWRRHNHARVLLAQCKRSKDCSLTIEDVEQLISTGVCSVTGLPYTLNYEGPSRRNPWAPSIDRLDNSRGYHLGNVRAVCCAFNLTRGDFSDEVVLQMARALVSKEGLDG